MLIAAHLGSISNAGGQGRGKRPGGRGGGSAAETRPRWAQRNLDRRLRPVCTTLAMRKRVRGSASRTSTLRPSQCTHGRARLCLHLAPACAPSVPVSLKQPKRKEPSVSPLRGPERDRSAFWGAGDGCELVLMIPSSRAQLRASGGTGHAGYFPVSPQQPCPQAPAQRLPADSPGLRGNALP